MPAGPAGPPAPTRALRRRRVLGALGGAATAVTAAGSPAFGRIAGAAPHLIDEEVAPHLRPFPAAEPPFDLGARATLAQDALTYFVRQQGVFPGRSTFLLPAAPWLGGWAEMASRRAWDLTVPAGQPLYLLAHADPAGALDAAQTTITVNGAPLAGLAQYVHRGVAALHAGRSRAHAVLDLVFAPPPPGRYKIEVATRLPAVARPDEGDDGDAANDTRENGSPEHDAVTVPPLVQTVLAYDITVAPADALGPLLLRDPQGQLYATLGNRRRLVPDAETARALGYRPADALDASVAALEVLDEGTPLPALREGMLVSANNHPAVYRLTGGTRAWLRGFDSVWDEAGDVRTLDAAVLAAVPPVLQEDMLLKGHGADLFHVEQGALRKAPGITWVADRRLKPADILFVPERILATLPQNSPHWMMPGGTWVDRTFSSAAVGRTMPYRVFLPPDYHAASRAAERYPVLYLLHGMGGRYDEWSGYGVEEVANELHKNGKLPRMILVAPQGGLGYWMNQLDGAQWGDYVARDLVQHVDATYRTVARREGRAVGGLSMGGHGAVQLALTYPDVFGTAGAHSPSIRTEDSAPAYFGSGADFARRDPISLAHTARFTSPPRIWIDAGKDDPWKDRAEELHQALRARGWPHEWHVYEGGHDGWYWGDHLWEYLPFYAESFARHGVALTS